MSETLQRYNPEPTCIQSNSTTMSGVALRRHSEGIVVLYADAQRRIEELEAILTRIADGSACQYDSEDNCIGNERDAARAALKRGL